MVRLERLSPGEGDRWRRIRLQALSESPSAFGTTYDEAARWDAARWEQQVVDFATFVAVVEGHDVGVARGAANRAGEVRELISLWVAPTARRQGVAALLIESVARWAEASGARALVLDVIATNAPAIALYEANGFSRLDDEAVGGRIPRELRFVRALG